MPRDTNQSSRFLLLLRISVNTPGKRASVMPKFPATATADDSSGRRSSSTIKRMRCLRVKLLLSVSKDPLETLPPT